MAADFLMILASDESYIALLCDNLTTLATVWAEVRCDFFPAGRYSLLTRVSNLGSIRGCWFCEQT